jgi:LCP family protein required for cell wall assembly
LQRTAEISVPRDLRVDIPGYGVAKVNAAHALGGPNLTETVVGSVLGQDIPYYLRTDFSGLAALVDTLGGLDVMVKTELRDPEYPCDDDQYKVCGLDLKVGAYHMSGSTVLQYVRCRKGSCGSDFGRAARQQEVSRLLAAKILNPQLMLQPKRLAAIAETMHRFVATNLSLLALLQFANQWRLYTAQQAPHSLVLSTAAGGMLVGDQASSDLLPEAGDFSVIARRVATIFSE